MLQTCEIAEDLTYYFATSEQVPSAVGLGVLMNKNNTVRQAGGFIVQLMPFAEEEVISRLEQNVQKINSVTNLLEEGHTPESLLEKVLEGFDVQINEKMDTPFPLQLLQGASSESVDQHRQKRIKRNDPGRQANRDELPFL